MEPLSRDDAIAKAMRENMVDEVYRRQVDTLMDRADDDWRRCCDSQCEPCSITLGRVVDRARALMQG